MVKLGCCVNATTFRHYITGTIQFHEQPGDAIYSTQQPGDSIYSTQQTGDSIYNTQQPGDSISINSTQQPGDSINSTQQPGDSINSTQGAYTTSQELRAFDNTIEGGNWWTGNSHEQVLDAVSSINVLSIVIWKAVITQSAVANISARPLFLEGKMSPAESWASLA